MKAKLVRESLENKVNQQPYTLDDYIDDLLNYIYKIRGDMSYEERMVLWNSKRIIKPFFLKNVAIEEAWEQLEELLKDKAMKTWR